MAQGNLYRRGLLCVAVAALALHLPGCATSVRVTQPPDALTFGVFADPQYADREPTIGRYYRDSADKLAACIRTMNKARPAFVTMLGDFTDVARDDEAKLALLKRIDGIYRRFSGPRCYVMGNHELDLLSKEQFMAAVGMPAPQYSFDCGPFHCIVLDANYNRDFSPYRAGNFSWPQAYIPPDEQDWLASDLGRTDRKVIVFVHQTLDDDETAYGVKNAPAVRRVLEGSGKVIAVFQGHNHHGAYRRINDIPYFTMRGMVEGPGLKNNAYAVVRISPDGTIGIRGFGEQPNYPVR